MKVQISNGQFWLLAIALVVPMGHFVFLHLAMAFAGRNTWMSLLLSAVLGCSLVIIHGQVAARAREKSIVQSVFSSFGPWMGVPIGLVLVIYSILAGTVTLNMFSLFWGETLSRTPGIVFPLIVLGLAIGATYAGLEVIARLTQLLIPMLIVVGVGVSILTHKDKEFVEMLPLLYHGLLPIWRGTWMFLAMFSELLALLMMAPHVSHPEKLTRQGVIMMGVFAVMFLGPVTGPVLIFGEPLAQSLSYPTYAEIQYIAYPNVLERIDLLGMLLWTFGSFLRICIFLYSATAAFAQTIRAASYRIYVVPISLLLIGSTELISTTREQLYAFLTIAYPTIAIGLAFVLPLLIIVALSLRRHFQHPPRRKQVRAKSGS